MYPVKISTLNNELFLEHTANLIEFELENERIIYGKNFLTAFELFNKITGCPLIPNATTGAIIVDWNVDEDDVLNYIKPFNENYILLRRKQNDSACDKINY